MLPVTPSLVLTANERLATALQSTQKQPCLSLKNWFLQNHATLEDAKMLLQEYQELALWEKIIADAAVEIPLFNPRATAQLAREAWRTLRQWQIPLSQLKGFDSIDVETFQRWAEIYAALCEQNGWLDFCDCVDIIIARIDAIALPQQITLTGFEEVTPQIQKFFSALEKQVTLEFSTFNCEAAVCHSFAALEEESEIQAMAEWAIDLWEKNPHYKIGCVAPKLNALHESILRIFTRARPFVLPLNISGGKSFLDYPLVHTALQILRLNTEKISLEDMSQLLRSPFIGAAEQERLARAEAEMVLRQLNERFFSLTHLKNSTALLALCPAFFACLENLSSLKFSTKQLPSHWAETFSLQLDGMGWPGERATDSTEYQQLQRFQTLLQEFSSLDFIFPKKMRRFEAVQQLQNLAKNILFQPQNTATAIQVLGVLEATGMQFDALWVMGMNEEQWPAAPAPNPFIPLPLQKQHHMPHASSEREFAFSQRLTERFSQSAPQVIFSYSLKKEDVVLYPSPLILKFIPWSVDRSPEGLASSIPLAVIPAKAGIQGDSSKDWIPAFAGMTAKGRKGLDEILKKAEWEYIEDDYAPPLLPDEIPKGGANILKHQAACPFRAFAKSRLHAESLPVPVSGLSAQERGNDLHAILEEIWRLLQNQATLLAYPEAELDVLIDSVIEKIFQKKLQQRPHGLQTQFCEIEKQRLHARTKDWLALEKQRPPFKVAQQEAISKMQFAGLNLTLRIDREDILENGKRILIDYKTGLPHLGDWFGDRPNDPQLPLYFLTRHYPVHALVFAQLHASKIQFKGLSDAEMDIKGVIPIEKQNLAENITTWADFHTTQQTTLSNLAQDFCNGDARVNPKEKASCTYCDLQALCRI